MTAEATVEALITNQEARAAAALESARTYADQAQTAAISIVSLGGHPDVTVPNIVIPAPTTADQATELLSFYNGAFADFNPQFNTLWQTFMDDFFPEVDGCVQALSDAWLCRVMEGGDGLPAAVETAIWDRERGRENELALHNAEQAVDEWAARGFTLPPGALAMRVRQANQDAINKTATQSRDRAIENARINIESVRFAVGQAIQLRLGAVQAAFNYIRTWFLVPQTAIEKAKALTDARLRFYASTSAYYNALIGAAQAKITAQAHNQGAAVSENRTFGQVAAASVESRTGAALSAAQAMGMCAAGALASINTLANVGHNTAAQE